MNAKKHDIKLSLFLRYFNLNFEIHWTKKVRDNDFQYIFFGHIKLDSGFYNFGICSNYLAII